MKTIFDSMIEGNSFPSKWARACNSSPGYKWNDYITAIGFWRGRASELVIPELNLVCPSDIIINIWLLDTFLEVTKT